MYYITSGIVCYSWFLYSENIQQPRLIKNKIIMMLCTIPVIILVVLTVASVKYKFLFYIDTMNTYHRGKYYPIQLICSWGYVLFTAIKAWIGSVRTNSYSQRVEYRTLGNYVIAPVVCGFFQVLMPGTTLICVGTTIGCLYVFITIQEQMISTDVLTGLNNRNKLMQYLSDRIQNINNKTCLFLVMMDLDGFKIINDKYGHVEGDIALCMVSSALKECCKNRSCFIARYGGDEFSAICEFAGEDGIEDFEKNVKELIHEKSVSCQYKLSLSMGWKKYDNSIKTELEFIKLADAELYKIKKHKKNF